MSRLVTVSFLLVCLAQFGCSALNGANEKRQNLPAETGGQKQPVKQDQAGGQTPSSAEPASSAPRVVLLPPGRAPVNVRVEVARTNEERQRGLMFRRSLEPDAGMLFLFEEQQHLTFWMHNTYIPLDMIFIDSDLTVIGVKENTTPMSDATCDVPGVSQYVLEVNAGFSRRSGVGAGTRVQFVNVM